MHTICVIWKSISRFLKKGLNSASFHQMVGKLGMKDSYSSA